MLGFDVVKARGSAVVLACILALSFAPVSLFAQEATKKEEANKPASESAPTAPENPATVPLSPETKAAPVLPPTTREKSVAGQPESLRKDRSDAMVTAGETLTLGRCIEIALKKNPNIVAAANTVEVSRSKVGEARSAYYPQLSAKGEYISSKTASGASYGTTVGTTPYNQYQGSVILNQTLYDFGKTSSSVDISKYNLEASRSDLSTTQDSVIANVKQTYYGVLQTRRNRDVALDVIKQFQLHLDQAQGFYDVGTRAKIDVIKAKVDLSNAKLSLINAENALKIAWVNLNNALGVPNAPEYAVEDNFSHEPYAITLEEATARAFGNRPDLKAIIAKRQAAEENISFARSGYAPVLSGSAQYTSQEQDKAPYQQNVGWTAGVAMTIPLFSGFLTSHQVAEAKSGLYVLRANEESVRQQILLDVRQAFLNLQAAEASIAATDLIVKQAQENLDLANGRYAAGVGSPVEVSDAFATYVTAQANYTGALYNYKLAQATIEKAMGAR
jgi:outer membrane protein